MNANDWYKACGLLSVLITWLAISFVLYRTPRTLSKSISHHAALQKREYRVFAVSMTVALFLMFVFVMKWLVPVFSLDPFVVVVLVAGLILELVTTWVPLTHGPSYTLHNYLSYGTALILPFALFGIVITSTVSSAVIAAIYVAMAIMVLLMVVFLTITKARERYLLYQSTYIAAFHFAIISIAFLS